MKQCHACLAEAVYLTRIGRRDICDGCGADLHCCRNCRHHDPFAQNECREPSTEAVGDREAGNFCEFFSFRDGPPDGRGDDPVAIAKAKLDALFKN